MPNYMSVCQYVCLYVNLYAFLFHQSASVLVSLSVRTVCVYVVAILRRLLKNICHFCKLNKSDLYFGKATCILTVLTVC